MKQLKLIKIISLSLILMTLITVTAYINYDNLVGAFGSGPPYYNQTENMDKWQNPIPFLLLINIVVIFLSVVGFKWIASFRKQ